MLTLFACSSSHLVRFLTFTFLFSYLQPDKARTVETTLRRGITDSGGAALATTSITLSNHSTGLGRVGINATNGKFVIAAVKGSRYQLTISAIGFATASRKIKSSPAGAINFALEVAALSERITCVSGS